VRRPECDATGHADHRRICRDRHGACLRVCRHGHELLLIARREQRLAELADAIAAQGHKRPLMLRSISLRPMRSAASLTRLRSSTSSPRRWSQRRFRLVRSRGEARPGRATRHDRSDVACSPICHSPLSDAAAPSWWHSQCGLGRGLPARPAWPSTTPAKPMCCPSAGAASRAPAARRAVTVLCLVRCRPSSRRVRGVRNERYPSLVKQDGPEQVAAGGYRGLMAGRRLVVPGIGNKLVTFCCARRRTRLARPGSRPSSDFRAMNDHDRTPKAILVVPAPPTIPRPAGSVMR